jgi:hypothetical protein
MYSFEKKKLKIHEKGDLQVIMGEIPLSFQLKSSKLLKKG